MKERLKRDLWLKKTLVIALAITVVFTGSIGHFALAQEPKTPLATSPMIEKVMSELPPAVEAEISVEKSAEVGKPFGLSVMLHLPRILTYEYDPALPPSKMFDQYRNVKALIPLPKGITAVEGSTVDENGNLVVDFPSESEFDFQGDTVKSRNIKLKVKDNGAVANGTDFIFSGATWQCDVDVYTDAAKVTKETTTVTGSMNQETHQAIAGDTWGIRKSFDHVTETEDQVVFTFNVDTGLEKERIDGKSVLYSTATEEYDRYGRLNFSQYQVTDFMPELIQVNKDGTEIKKNIYPESVSVTKAPVAAYEIAEEAIPVAYDKDTTRSIDFSKYNQYDPNAGTDTIGISPQFTRYQIKLAYPKKPFVLSSTDSATSTIKLINRASLEYQLVGEEKVTVNASADASYIIRNGSGQVVVKKYLVYPENGTQKTVLYDTAVNSEFPLENAGGGLSFQLYEDKDCTKLATDLGGNLAKVQYDIENARTVFGRMESGTYYLKEKGTVEGFAPEKEVVQVVVPRAGGTVTTDFKNVNADFSAITIVKHEGINKDTQPLPGVTFRLYDVETDAKNFADTGYRKTSATDSNGEAFLNKLPVGTYYVREDLPESMKDSYYPNDTVYTLHVTKDGTQGLKAGGQFYGTETNPLVNEMRIGILYLGVVKWDVQLKNLSEINYLYQSPNQVKPVASAVSAAKLKLYHEDESGNIVPYMENGSQVTLTADSNGLIRKALPTGEYYVVAESKQGYTPWAQGNAKMEDETYYMGSFHVEAGMDNNNLPSPDKDGNVNWNQYDGVTDQKREANVIHYFSGSRNLSLKKLGSMGYVVPEARFDIYKISRKGESLAGKKPWQPGVKTNEKAYAFFADVEPGWYAVVETATGPQYYLPEAESDRRQDIEVKAPVFDQTIKGVKGIEVHQKEMIAAATLVSFNNQTMDEAEDVPLIGMTFEKVDAVTGQRLYNGAKYNVYYMDGGNRVYLKGYYYKTNTRKDANGKPVNKTYITQGSDYIPSYADDTTTMVGIIPQKLLNQDTELFVEEVVAPLGYILPEAKEERIKSVVVKGGTIDTKNVVRLSDQPRPPAVSITVAVSNRSYAQTVNLQSAQDRGTFVEGSAVRLYEWDEAAKSWKYVAQKNTSINGTYKEESGAVFEVEYGKTYAIAEKKSGNQGNLDLYSVDHMWLKNESADKLTPGNGTDGGTYSLNYQGSVDGWSLYGKMTMPANTAKAENYKFTFYNLPRQQFWLKKVDHKGKIIEANGIFDIYEIPKGQSAYAPVSDLIKKATYSNHGNYETYKGVSLPVGNYVIVERRAPNGYSNYGKRYAFSINNNIQNIPGTNQIGILGEMSNYSIEYLRSIAANNMKKEVRLPANKKIEESLLGDPGENVKVSYTISQISLKPNSLIKYRNTVLADEGLSYYEGLGGNGTAIKMEEKDYAFDSISIAKATDHSAAFVKAQVSYQTMGKTTWQKAGEPITLSKNSNTVNLSAFAKNVTKFKVEYLDVSGGFNGGDVTVDATLNKRDAGTYKKEITSIKNTAIYSYDYGINDENGVLQWMSSRKTDDALINVDPTKNYPKVAIAKSASIVEGGAENVVKAGDVIRYSITLGNAEGKDLQDPIILDKLPDEVRLLAKGKYKNYYDIAMPSGLELQEGPGVATYRNAQYVPLFFKGALKAGESITVQFESKVKADYVSIDDLIKNQAAGSSAKYGYQYEGNAAKAVFYDANGNWPQANSEYSDFVASINKEAYGYVLSKVDTPLETGTGLTIKKFVKGELDFDPDNGYQDHISNTLPGGRVHFRVIMQNNGEQPATNLRITDLLPQAGDDRASKWQPILKKYTLTKVDQNGTRTTVTPTVYTARGSYNAGLYTASIDWKSLWKTDAFSSSTTALGFDCGDTVLQKGEYLILDIEMTAPETGQFAGTFAGNDAKLYYNSGDSENTSVQSNIVYTIYHTRPVGMGGLVFVDKDMDGLRSEGEETVSGVPVRLYVYEDGKQREILTTVTDADGRYYFDNLMPSYVDENGKFVGHSYQYQTEFVVPEGTCLTGQYAGGADSWKDHVAGTAGSPKAPGTTGDPAYTAKDRDKDSNADVKTQRSEIFYLNPCEDRNAAIRTEAGGYDLTYDAGLVRTREIEIHKIDGNLQPLPGAKFQLTGTGLPATGILATADEKGTVLFANPITIDGKDYRINYYGNYKVEEVFAPEGYVNQGWSQTILSGSDSKATYAFLDEKTTERFSVINEQVTQLKITKTVQFGTEEEMAKDVFRFQVLLDGHVYQGDYTVTDSNGAVQTKDTKDSEGFVILKHGESAVISQLESGMLYVVNEMETQGYTSVGTNDFGILASDNAKNVVSYINEKEKGYVKFSKQYVGSSLYKNEDFLFHVTLEGKPYTGYYNIDGVSHTTEDGTITLKHNQTATIAGGLGQKFEIREEAGERYVTAITADKGITAFETDRKVSGTVTETIQNAQFTNTLETDGLAVVKTLDSPGIPGHYDDNNFVFKLEVDGKPYRGEYTFYPVKGETAGGYKKFTEDGTFMISARTAVHFDTLPKGAAYQVTELDLPENKLAYTAENKVITGVVGTTREVQFVNRFDGPKTISIEKQVTGKPDETRAFTFRLYLDGRAVAPVTYRVSHLDGTEDNVTSEDGTILLKSGEKASIGGIPVGAVYKVEEDVADDFRTIVPTNASGTVGADDITMTFENSYDNPSAGEKYDVAVRKKVVSPIAADHDATYYFGIGIKTAEYNQWQVPAYLYIRDTTQPLKEGVNPRKFSGVEEDIILHPNSSGGRLKKVPLKATEELIIPSDRIATALDPKYSKGQPVQFEVMELQQNGNMNVSWETTETKEKGTNNDYVFSISSTDPGYTERIIFTNTSTETPTEKYGNLMIKKRVTMGEVDPGTTFRLLVEQKVGDVFIPYAGDLTSSSRSTLSTTNGLVDIKHDETLTISDQLVGTQFRVTELMENSDPPLYRVSYNPTNGVATIKDPSEPSVLISIANVMQTSSLDIEKINVGGNEEDIFHYTVSIDGKPYDGKYFLYDSLDATSSNPVATMTDGKFTLKGNQKIRINRLKPGVPYLVEEEASADYVTDSLVRAGVTEPRVDGNVVTTTARFVNTIKKSGLTITKSLVGGSSDDLFYFDVQIKAPGTSSFVPYMGVYSVTDGQADLTPENGRIAIKGNQAAVLPDVAVGSEFKVTEVANENYTQTKTDGTTGVLGEAGGLVTFENKRKTNALAIEKRQVGGDPTDSFNFTLYLNGALANTQYDLYEGADKIETGLSIIDGALTLKGGQRAVIEGIDTGTEYRIIEEDRADYEEGFLAMAGLIEEGENKETFINTKKQASLLFEKQLVGGNPDDVFGFLLTVSEQPYDGAYTVTTGETSEERTTTDGRIQIKAGQKVEVRLPSGSTYILKEQVPMGYDALTPVVNIAGLEEVSTAQVSAGSATGTIHDGILSLQFTNVATSNGTLEINKIRQGGSDRDTFTFDVKVAAAPYNGSCTIYDVEGTFVETKTVAGGSITIQGGGRILLTDIAIGSVYTVTEREAAGYTGSGEVSGTIIQRTPQEGSLSANVADFVNVYAAGGLAVTKELVNSNSTEDFHFTILGQGLDETEPSPLYGKDYVLYEKGAGDVWNEIPDQEGLFVTDGDGSFTLKGNQKAVFEGLDKGMGITVSEASNAAYTTAVKVGEGAFTDGSAANITISEDLQEAVFRNTAILPEVNLQVKKAYQDKDGNAVSLAAGDFQFTLAALNGAPMSTGANAAQAVNDENGAVKFDKILFTDEGTYQYEIKEVQIENPGIDYDKGTITATVDVTTNAEGKLVAEVTYQKDSQLVADPTFTNTYVEPTPVTSNLQAKKTYQSEDGSAREIDNGQFKLKLVAVTTGAPMPTTGIDANGVLAIPANAGGSATVDFGITFGDKDAGQTYKYKITEVAGSDTGNIVYDETTYIATVTITKDKADNTLKTEVTYQKEDADGTVESIVGIPDFMNRYKSDAAISLPLGFIKTYKDSDGNTVIFKPDKFTFKLSATDGTPMPKETIGGLQVPTENTDGSKTYSFGQIKFTTPGTYKYTIQETKGDDGSIVYDTDAITATVVVTRPENSNQLTAAVTYQKGKTSFDTTIFDGTELDLNKQNLATIANQKAEPGTAQFTVNKAYMDSKGTSVAFDEGKFTFLLDAATDGAPMPDKAIASVGVSDSDTGIGTATFGKVTYTEAGTYRYTIKEQQIASGAEGYDPAVTYDEETMNVTVRVAQNAEKKLTAAVTYQKGSEGGQLEEPQTFENKQKDPEASSVALQVKKQYANDTGDTIDVESFTFRLTAQDNAPMPNDAQTEAGKQYVEKKQTIVGGAVETVNFGDIAYTEAGIYTYIITEVPDETKKHVHYDTEQNITGIVKVTRDVATNKLKTSVTYAKGTTTASATIPIFTNTYVKPGSATAKVGVSKEYAKDSVRLPFQEGTFSFTLKAATDDAPMPTNAKASVSASDDTTKIGTATFDTITYEKAGTYKYVITENNVDNPAVEKDQNSIDVTVDVTKNVENQLVAEVTYEKGGEQTDDPMFTNTYVKPSDVSIQLEVIKRYANQQADTENSRTFSFELKSGDGAPMPENNQKSLALTKNGEATGIVTFGDITFTDDHVGKTYAYTITEIVPKAGDTGYDPSITYDETPITATVTVIKNAENKLKTSIVYQKGKETVNESTFTNAYVVPQAGNAEIGIVKNYHDKDGTPLPIVQDQFMFQMEAITTDAPESLPMAAMKDNTPGDMAAGTKNYSFGQITYTEEGTYWYVISETKGINSSISYDDKVIYVKVEVIKDAMENLLNTETTYYRSPRLEAETEENLKKLTPIDASQLPTFENVYYAPAEVEIDLKAKKSLEGRNLVAGEFTFALKDEEDVQVDTATNGADGSIVFAPLKFTEDPGAESNKTYTYTITEQKGSDPSITAYDSGKITATITVTKDEQNQLQAAVTYSKNDPASAEIRTFKNTYTPPAATIEQLQVRKHFRMKDESEARDIEEGQFSFRLKAFGTAPMPTGSIAPLTVETKGSADGTENIAFGEMNFDEAGIYWYEIKEQIVTPGDEDYNASIVYDTGYIYVKVDVRRETTVNQLAAVKTYYYTAEPIAEPSEEALKGVAETTDPAFTNEYDEPEDISISFEAEKTLTGASLENYVGHFRFVLKDADGNQIGEAATNDENGKVLFDNAVTYKEADAGKTFDYTIEEVRPSKGEEGFDPSITYDEKVIYVQAAVGKKDDNTLRTDVTYKKDDEGTVDDLVKAFENIYTAPEPTEDYFQVKKHYLEMVKTEDEEIAYIDRPMRAEQFEFALQGVRMEGEGNEKRPLPMPVRANEDGIQKCQNTTTDAKETIRFDSIEYTEAGTYWYCITETKGTDSSIAYDGHYMYIKVVVSIDDDNKLQTMITYYESDHKKEDPTTENWLDAMKTTDPTFVNRYTPPVMEQPIELKLKKFYQNQQLQGEDFEFDLISQNDNVPGETKGEVVQTVKNDKDGNIQFVPLQLYADPGSGTLTYHYIVKETNAKKAFVVYDDKQFHVTITVTKDIRENILHSQITYYVEVDVPAEGENPATTKKEEVKETPTFINRFVSPSPPVTSGQVTPQVNKLFKNGTLHDGEFQFILADASGTVLETVSNKASGLVTFSALKFGESQISSSPLTYTIREVAGTAEGVTYDDAVITMIVTLRRGTANNVTAEVRYLKDGVELATAPTFVNTKKKEPAAPDGPHCNLPPSSNLPVDSKKPLYNEDGTPRTSDDNFLGAYAAALVSSVGAIFGLSRRRKKKSKLSKTTKPN